MDTTYKKLNVDTIKRIYKNYNLLKSFAKSSTRISIPNDSY